MSRFSLAAKQNTVLCSHPKKIRCAAEANIFGITNKKHCTLFSRAAKIFGVRTKALYAKKYSAFVRNPKVKEFRCAAEQNKVL
jgi:hypothetical protein